MNLNIDSYKFIRDTISNAIQSNSKEEVLGSLKTLLMFLDTLETDSTKLIATNYKNKIAVIKELRRYFGWTLAQAKQATETSDNVIFCSDKFSEVRDVEALIAPFCTTEIKGSKTAIKLLFNYRSKND